MPHIPYLWPWWIWPVAWAAFRAVRLLIGLELRRQFGMWPWNRHKTWNRYKIRRQDEHHRQGR